MPTRRRHHLRHWPQRGHSCHHRAERGSNVQPYSKASARWAECPQVVPTPRRHWPQRGHSCHHRAERGSNVQPYTKTRPVGPNAPKWCRRPVGIGPSGATLATLERKGYIGTKLAIQASARWAECPKVVPTPRRHWPQRGHSCHHRAKRINRHQTRYPNLGPMGRMPTRRRHHQKHPSPRFPPVFTS